MKKVEQINSCLSLIEDYDHKLTRKSEFIDAYNSALGVNAVYTEKYGKRSFVYVYEHNGIKEYFLTANVVYLGHPHPLFKKRIELKDWYKPFYDKHKNLPNTKIHLIGIYSYDNVNVFVDFKIDSYLENEFNNSAAHVYTNDIFQALTNGTFQKIDARNNTITTIRRDKFKQFITENKIDGNKLFSLFEKFNCGFPFGKWITAVKAITEMKDKNFSKWAETEWAGWFLELKFYEYTDQVKCKELMKYSKDFSKLEKEFDFDIYFKEEDFYGDLKASNISGVEVILNAQDSVEPCILKHGKLWYVIYEHLTEKDIDHKNEMAIARMKLKGDEYIEGGRISYPQLKHSVNFQKMEIVELNRINYHEVLTAFNQGHQPDGKKRKPKFKFSKKNVENFIIYSYKVN